MLLLLCISIEKIAAFVSLILPVTLLWWFYYSQRDIYFKDIIGIYAGYPDGEQEMTEDGKGRMEAGLIMNITDAVSGYFRGEFDYRKNVNDLMSSRMLHDGIYSFYGNLKFSPHLHLIFKSSSILK